MAPPIPNHWTTDPEYIDLLNYIIEKTENVKSPISIHRTAGEFKENSGAAQTKHCLERRIVTFRTRIHTFAHLDKNTKVKLLFALSASVDANFLKQLKRDALVETDEKKRITHYKENDGHLELKGDHSQSAKQKQIESKGSIRSFVSNYFKKRNVADAVPESEEEEEMWNFIEFITEKCENIHSPLSIRQLARDFNEHFEISRSLCCIRERVKTYCREIQTLEFLDNQLKVKQLFGLSQSAVPIFLEELRKHDVVEVDENNRITHYKAKNGSLELRGDHSKSARNRINMLESKRGLRSLIRNYFGKNKNADAVPENEEEKAMWNLIDLITEKCKNVDSPLSIDRLSKDFREHFGTTKPIASIRARIKGYCREIQRVELLDTHTKVKQLFGLSVESDSDCLKKLRKDALVEVDDKNRIIKYTANDGSLTLQGGHWGSKKSTPRRVEKKNEKNVVNDDSEEDSDNDGLNDDSSDEYSSEEFDSEFDSDEDDPLNDTEDHMDPSTLKNETPVRNRSSTYMSIDDNFDFDPPTERSYTPEDAGMRKDEENENDSEATDKAGIKTRYGRLSKSRYPDLKDDSDSESENGKGCLDKPYNAVEPSNEADDSVNEIPARSNSSTNMSIGDNIDFDPPSEKSDRSEETEMREDEGNDPGITGNAAVKTRCLPIATLPKSKTTSSTSRTPKSSKRKAAPSGSILSKRTKPSLERSMNSGETNDNISHDDPSRVELEPLRELLGFRNGIEKDPNIQQIPKPRPQIMEAPIKKEYEDQAQTSLKMILNGFKSLILSLDTPGLSQFQMELDKKIMETGRRIEVSNEEVILAMEFLIVKLSKHGALESSEDSIGLRDILLMLRTIILNSSFNGLEVILETLKENIEHLKVLDKRIPVSKVECVLRATLDNICT